METKLKKRIRWKFWLALVVVVVALEVITRIWPGPSLRMR
jgi:hypothetical protein